MPHEVADLEPVLLMLSKQNVNDLQVVLLLYLQEHSINKYECIFGVLLIEDLSEINLYYYIMNQVFVNVNFN